MHKKGHARGKENWNLWQEVWTLSAQDLILLSLTCVNRIKSLVIRRIPLVGGKGEQTLVSHLGGKGAKKRERVSRAQTVGLNLKRGSTA